MVKLLGAALVAGGCAWLGFRRALELKDRVRALEQMLFYPKPADQRTEFTLLAFEGYAVPLVSLLTDGCRAEVAERYKKRTPPRRMMPNQKKLWRALTRH